VTYHATICNLSVKDVSGGFDLALFYHRKAAPGCASSPDQSLTIKGLQAGVCTTRSFTRSGAPPGATTAWVLVDAGCAVSELDESNNADSVQVQVSLPDLAVTHLYDLHVSADGQAAWPAADPEPGSAAGGMPGCDCRVAAREGVVSPGWLLALTLALTLGLALALWMTRRRRR
jgi:hypothetical protein